MKKTAKIILGVFAIVFALWGVVAYFAPGQCTLCNFIKSHAPCIVNMQTGEVQELDLYFPHRTLVAELADPQPEQGTIRKLPLHRCIRKCAMEKGFRIPENGQPQHGMA